MLKIIEKIRKMNNELIRIEIIRSYKRKMLKNHWIIIELSSKNGEKSLTNVEKMSKNNSILLKNVENVEKSLKNP